jgi:histidyl-tRNA synthetase
MSELLSPLPGFSDLAFPEICAWRFLEERARAVLALYGYREIRTPVVERVETFTHSLGDTTDIVQKEMYAFQDRGGRSLVLRPEGTAGVMRWVAAQGQELRSPRLFYLGPMFRAERPQAGRKRQFHQLGLECIGAPSPGLDAEVIALQSRLFQAWGVPSPVFQLNTRGAGDDLATAREALRERLAPRRGELCADCQRRFDQNLLRVLDCKNPACGAVTTDLPPLTDFMSPASRDYFDAVRRRLDRLGVAHAVNPRLIRGLDYYQHVVWEVTSAALGAQDALSGGGRYVVRVGGRTVEGVGFGIGLERVLMALALDEAGQRALDPGLDVFLVAQNEAALEANLDLVEALRAAGLRCVMEPELKSMKAQMKAADRWAARRVLLRGESELAEGTLTVKDLSTGAQARVPAGQILAHLRETLA